MYYSRAYPSALRIDSSNFDQADSWAAGMQLTALNYQTNDLHLRAYKGKNTYNSYFDNYILLYYIHFIVLATGKFRENGNTGYVLKPDYLLNYPYTPPPARSVTLTLTIISGWQLPKPRGVYNHKSNSSKHRIISPFVTVTMTGQHSDRTKWTTRTINENGFNPVWNEVELFM